MEASKIHTPWRRSADLRVRGHPSGTAMKNATWAEHEGSKVSAGENWVRELFTLSDDVSTHLDAFIATRYDDAQGCWKEMPPPPVAAEKELYSPLVKLINDVLEHHSYSDLRRCYQTSSQPLVQSSVDENTNFKSSCDILCVGLGPHISDWRRFPENPDTYKRAVSGFEVKTDAMFDDKRNLEQVTYYGHHLITSQENRSLCFVVLISDTMLRVFQYNRSGFTYSPKIYWQKEPKLFARIVLGVCSLDVATIGYDTSFFWEYPPSLLSPPSPPPSGTPQPAVDVLPRLGTRMGIDDPSLPPDTPSVAPPSAQRSHETAAAPPALSTRSRVNKRQAEEMELSPPRLLASDAFDYNPFETVAAGGAKLYFHSESPTFKALYGDRRWRVYKDRALVQRKAVRGRGSVIWVLERDDRYIARKENWQAVKRTPKEPVIYKLAEMFGIRGVGKMYGYDWGHSLSAFRGKVGNTADDGQSVSDRILVCLYLEPYLDTIENFSSRTELLEVLVGALTGHRELYTKIGVLHRDVSVGNILRTRGMQKDGLTGRLVDFDLAIFWMRQKNNADFDTMTGTRMYQSLNVLSYCSICGPHDYADDLESFFWVVCSLGLQMESPGVVAKGHSDLLAGWADENPIVARKAKSDFLERREPWEKYLSSWWLEGDVFPQLLDFLQDLCIQIQKRRSTPKTTQVRPPAAGWASMREETGVYRPTVVDAQADLGPGKTGEVTLPDIPDMPEEDFFKDEYAILTTEVRNIIALRAAQVEPDYDLFLKAINYALKEVSAIDAADNTQRPPPASSPARATPEPDSPTPSGRDRPTVLMDRSEGGSVKRQRTTESKSATSSSATPAIADDAQAPGPSHRGGGQGRRARGGRGVSGRGARAQGKTSSQSQKRGTKN